MLTNRDMKFIWSIVQYIALAGGLFTYRVKDMKADTCALYIDRMGALEESIKEVMEMPA